MKDINNSNRPPTSCLTKMCKNWKKKEIKICTDMD